MVGGEGGEGGGEEENASSEWLMPVHFFIEILPLFFCLSYFFLLHPASFWGLFAQVTKYPSICIASRN